MLLLSHGSEPSFQEFSTCCNKLSKTHIEQLKALGSFAGMADTSQITLF